MLARVQSCKLPTFPTLAPSHTIAIRRRRSRRRGLDRTHLRWNFKWAKQNMFLLFFSRTDRFWRFLLVLNKRCMTFLVISWWFDVILVKIEGLVSTHAVLWGLSKGSKLIEVDRSWSKLIDVARKLTGRRTDDKWSVIIMDADNLYTSCTIIIIWL